MILVVDDDLATLRALVVLLEREGHIVVGVPSVADALTVCEAAVPELIITDLLMPTQGGSDLLRKLKQDQLFDGVPRIVLSAYCPDDPNHEDTRRELTELGATAILLKPVPADELMLAVERAMESGP